MQFFDVNTNYRQAREFKKQYAHSKDFEKEPLEWYDRMIDVMMSEIPGIANRFQGGALLTLEGEQDWIRNGSPYFKVYPAIATMMSEVSIDIPVSCFHVPYQCFMIQLANNDQNDFIEKDDLRLKWIMVYQRRLTFVKGSREDYQFRPVEDELNEVYPGGSALFVNYEFTGTYKGEPNQYNYTLRLDPEVGTFEDFFEKSYDSTIGFVRQVTKHDEYLPSKEMTKRVLSLAIATSFFGVDNHEIVMPDIPRKKLEKRLARSESVEQMKEQLREDKEDTKRWTIGREISLPRPIYEAAATCGGEHQPRERTHAHIRKGHMRYQVCGKNRSERKLTFIHQHMVRPDLPLAPSHGYKIPDSVIH